MKSYGGGWMKWSIKGRKKKMWKKRTHFRKLFMQRFSRIQKTLFEIYFM